MKKKLVFCFLILISFSLWARKPAAGSSDGIKYDLDFTKMNYNIASGVLFDIIVNPENYVNKSVKFSGQFVTSVYEEKRYYSFVLWDKTLCCPAGLSFRLAKTSIFPDDFPEENSFASATGYMKWVKYEDEEKLLFLVDQWTPEK